MWDAAPALRDAVGRSHDMAVTVTVVRGNRTLGDIPIVDGTVDATLLNTDGRSAALVVDYDVIRNGVLDPLSDEVVIRSGVPGLEMVPLFTGHVDTIRDTSDETGYGRVAVTCVSRGTDVVRDRFDTPFVTRAGAQVREEIRRIIQRTNPAWGVDISRAPDTAAPALLWEEDPGKALDELAGAINCVWTPDRTGGFRLLPSVFTAVDTGATVGAPTAVWTLRDGDGGCLVGIGHTRGRANIWNSVTVVVERTDAAAPFHVTVRDTDPASKTYWGGPFGKQGKIIKTVTPLTLADATIQATRILRQSLAIVRSWTVTTPHNPLLDPGDVVAVWHRDEVTAHVVESVKFPLRPDAVTVLATRELVVAPA